MGRLFISNAMFLGRKELGDNFNAILCSGYKNYLFWFAVDTAVSVQIVADVGTKLIVSFVRFILDFSLVFLLRKGIINILAPLFPRKEVRLTFIMFKILEIWG